MSLVYIVAAAPWGPIRIETAARWGDMLGRITSAPAHVEDVGALDASEVAEAARGMLGKADAAGWIASTVQAAVRAVQQARATAPARVIAVEPMMAAAELPESQAGGNGQAVDIPSPSLDERYHAPRPSIDVSAIRHRFRMSQRAFAHAFGVAHRTLQDWEQNRTAPDETARAFLRVIQLRPDAVREALEEARAADAKEAGRAQPEACGSRGERTESP